MGSVTEFNGKAVDDEGLCPEADEPTLWTAQGSSLAVTRARYTADGTPEFEAADFKEMQDRQRGPDILTAQEMARLLEDKERGTMHFKAGRVKEACQEYNRAIEVFGDRPGGTVEQRREKSKLFANRAECLLRLEEWAAAEKAAMRATELDATNAKARYRRARALEALGGEAQLQMAVVELGRIEPMGGAEHQLLRRIHAARDALREVRRRDAGGLRRAFAAGGLKLATSSDEERARTRPLAAPAGKSIIGTPLAPHPDDVQPPLAQLPRWLCTLADAGHVTRSRYLVDIYRTAVDDAMNGAATGRAAHGLGAPNYSPCSLMMDFLIFCKLALVRGVLPRSYPWDWDACLRDAPARLLCRFSPEVSQPANAYGPAAGAPAAMREIVSFVYDDDVHHAEVLRGRPVAELRAEWMRSVGYSEVRVTGGKADDADDDDDDDDDDGKPSSSVARAACGGRPPAVQHRLTFDLDPSVFSEVGGVHLWRLLLNQLSARIHA